MHGPGEVPDLQSKPLTSPEGQFKRVEVSALTVHTTAAARGLAPDHRRCRFTDEPEVARGRARAPGGAAGDLRPDTPVYSYNLCRRTCRARLARDLCLCVPHLLGPMCESKSSR